MKTGTHFFIRTVVFALLPAVACAQVREEVETEAGPAKVEVIAKGLEHPWGMAFLPDGRLLVTERAGRLRIVSISRKLSEPLAGVPKVLAQGQGGLLDVALHPKFDTNGLVYLSFAEANEAGEASTALGRGRLGSEGIQNFEVIFRQEPKVPGDKHFGGRIVFAADGTLFLTHGERFKFQPAQDLSNHLGKIVRLTEDGKPAAENPFLGKTQARAEIWSYGHRNIEAAALHPETFRLWIVEMGPQGGDELNLIQSGGNYGWPLVSWGEHYDGKDIPDPPTQPSFVDAVKHWTPVISPSGMVFYRGSMFTAWKDSALIGGLSSRGIVRVAISDEQVLNEERIPLGARIRDVEEAPDGSIYVLTDQSDGKVLRLYRSS